MVSLINKGKNKMYKSKAQRKRDMFYYTLSAIIGIPSIAFILFILFLSVTI
jgi:hypothetical protein